MSEKEYSDRDLLVQVVERLDGLKDNFAEFKAEVRERLGKHDERLEALERGGAPSGGFRLPGLFGVVGLLTGAIGTILGQGKVNP